MNTYRLARQSLLHPLDFYYEIQFEGRSKIWAALIIIALTIITRIFTLLYTGFSFNTLQPHQISVIIQIAWIVIPWLTWSVTNWAVSAIKDGEGKFADILSSSAFIFVPYIVIGIPITIVSNILTHDEASIFNGIGMITLFWMVFMLLTQVKVVHDFELGKAVWITFLSVLGMFLIWFIVIMMFGLVNQSFSFIVNLFKEVSYRM